MRSEQIGRYEVLETLARGGMGVVYKAKDPLIDRVVAIKTLGLGLSPIEAEAFRKRFAREAKSAGRLNHPNIVTIHDMGESDDGAYIAMEFLEGRTLRDILDSGVVLRPRRSPTSPCRSPTDSRSRTRTTSSIATSSLRTSWCSRTAP